MVHALKSARDEAKIGKLNFIDSYSFSSLQCSVEKFRPYNRGIIIELRHHRTMKGEKFAQLIPYGNQTIMPSELFTL